MSAPLSFIPDAGDRFSSLGASTSSPSAASGDRRSLLDALTSHIALYSSRSPPSRPTQPGPRSAILRWLSSLPAPARAAATAIYDADFLSTVRRMVTRLRRDGPTRFLVLDDLSSHLCSRRSVGLVARHDSSFSAASQFFSFVQAGVDNCVVVSENLMMDLERFVEIMDGISTGGFLNGYEEEVIISGGKELGWLRKKGYYTVEEFVANRIEITIRLSWMVNGGKKMRGGKAGRERIAAVERAKSEYWRCKGCMEWWGLMRNLYHQRVFSAFFGKGASLLADEILQDSALRDELTFCNDESSSLISTGWSLRSSKALIHKGTRTGNLNPFRVLSSREKHDISSCLNKILVVREIISLRSKIEDWEIDRLFFSPLALSGTISEYIVLKLRSLFMAMSLDYANRALFEDEKIVNLEIKSVEKTNAGPQKGKRKPVKSRNQKSKLPKDLSNGSIDNKSIATCSIKQASISSHDHSTGVADIANGLKRVVTSIENKSMATHSIQQASVSSHDHNIGNASIPVLPEDLERSVTSVGHEEHAVLSDCKHRHSKKKKNRKGRMKSINSLEHGDSEPGSVKSLTPSIHVEKEPVGPAELNDTLVSNHMVENILAEDFVVPRTINEMPNKEVLFDSCIDQGDSLDGSGHYDTKCQDNTATSPNALSNNFSLEESSMRCDQRSTSSLNLNSVNENCTVNKDGPSHIAGPALLNAIPPNVLSATFNEMGSLNKRNNGKFYVLDNRTTVGGGSFEWPSLTPTHFVHPDMQHLPAATDRLHLDVGYRWPTHSAQTFLHVNNQMRTSPVGGRHSQMVSPVAIPFSSDWPPVFRGYGSLNQGMPLGYDSAYTPMLQPSTFPTQVMLRASTFNEKERKQYADGEFRNTSDFNDDTESYYVSEEEPEAHGYSGGDYNQYFGGGVMYWSPAEYVGTGFSRPPSHSSDDSAWAWHEADVNRVIDDMVGVSGVSSSYNPNSVASPPTTPFCQPSDSVSPIQSVAYPVGGGNVVNTGLVNSPSKSNDSSEDASASVSNLSCNIEDANGDPLPYSMLRPIVVPSISRRGSRSDIRYGNDQKSSSLASNRADMPRVRRPPSPVVLCVPHVPRPPPPSPVGESRKKGFPIVRSGSSSPRHWGMRSFFSDEKILDKVQLCLDGPEVVWPSWGSKGILTAALEQPIPESVLQDHLFKISQLSQNQQHPDVALPLQPPEKMESTSCRMHNLLHEEINCFCEQVAASNLRRKPFVSWAVKRVTRCLQVLWPRSRTNIFGSTATGLALPTSDVDIVVSLPPVRNLEPIKEAGILEGRNGIKETCLQHAARCLANQEWVRSDSLKTVENTAIPVIMLMAEVPCYANLGIDNSSLENTHELSASAFGEQNSPRYSDNSYLENISLSIASNMKEDKASHVKSIRLDISFKSSSHTGLQTSELVRKLTQQFPAAVPLALVLKMFLADRSLDQSYSGGLSSYCLVLLITRFLQHEHHTGQPISQNLGSLLMDFLYFFGNVFDPRQMRISIQGSGVYMNRERGHSIDPIHIDDPLYPANNVGRNCFRIHQCIKAFADAFAVLENELEHFSEVSSSANSFRLLRKIIPSIDTVSGG